MALCMRLDAASPAPPQGRREPEEALDTREAVAVVVEKLPLYGRRNKGFRGADR